MVNRINEDAVTLSLHDTTRKGLATLTSVKFEVDVIHLLRVEFPVSSQHSFDERTTHCSIKARWNSQPGVVVGTGVANVGDGV